MLAESVIAAAELNVDPSRLSQLRAWLIAIWSVEVAACLAACIARPLTNLESMGLVLYAYNLLVVSWAACFCLHKVYQVGFSSAAAMFIFCLFAYLRFIIFFSGSIRVPHLLPSCTLT